MAGAPAASPRGERSDNNPHGRTACARRCVIDPPQRSGAAVRGDGSAEIRPLERALAACLHAVSFASFRSDGATVTHTVQVRWGHCTVTPPEPHCAMPSIGPVATCRYSADSIGDQ